MHRDERIWFMSSIDAQLFIQYIDKFFFFLVCVCLLILQRNGKILFVEAFIAHIWYNKQRPPKNHQRFRHCCRCRLFIQILFDIPNVSCELLPCLVEWIVWKLYLISRFFLFLSYSSLLLLLENGIVLRNIDLKFKKLKMINQ